MTPAYQAFLAHLDAYDWYEYREGHGYRVELLPEMEPDEIQLILNWIEVASKPDWPEARLLVAIGNKAISLATQVYDRANFPFKMIVLDWLYEAGEWDRQTLEDGIINGLKSATLLDGMTAVINLVKKHESEKLKHAVVYYSLHGTDDARFHFAALAHYLYGVTKVDFDQSRQPFYLRFNGPPKDRGAAFRTLCRELGLNEAEIQSLSFS